MYRDHTVAAVVPAYNEEGFVGDVIDALPGFVDRAYVVDDGSTDGTWDEITAHAKQRNFAHDGHFDRLVIPVQHDRNRGVGGAIKTGYRLAEMNEIDLTVVLGGDDQMDPAELTRYLDPIVDDVADYTKGNRFSRPEDYAEMPRFRLLGNVVLSYLTKVASGYWSTMDSQNGYTAISLSALEATDIDGMYEYYGYCNDLLVRLNVANQRVGDVPRGSEYAYEEGWKSHIDYREYVPRVSVMLARDFAWRLRQKYVVQRYEPIAALYGLGAGTAGVGVLGLLAGLVRRDHDGDVAGWFQALVGGLLVFLYAATLDRADNEHLERRIGREEEAAEGTEAVDEQEAAPPADEVLSGASVHADGGVEPATAGSDTEDDPNSGATEVTDR